MHGEEDMGVARMKWMMLEDSTAGAGHHCSTGNVYSAANSVNTFKSGFSLVLVVDPTCQVNMLPRGQTNEVAHQNQCNMSRCTGLWTTRQSCRGGWKGEGRLMRTNVVPSGRTCISQSPLGPGSPPARRASTIGQS